MTDWDATEKYFYVKSNNLDYRKVNECMTKYVFVVHMLWYILYAAKD